MNIKCSQENLLKALSVANKAVPTKSPLPILSNVLFKVEDGLLYLYASNLETSIKTLVKASVEGEGEFAVPSRLFTDFLSNLEPCLLDITLEETTLAVKSTQAKASFTCFPSEDFPLPPNTKEIASDLASKVLSKDLSLASQLCVFCASTDDAKPALTGVLLKKAQENLYVVATDGFRLSEKIIKTDKDSKDFSVLVPARIFGEVARMFAYLGDYVQIYYDEKDNLALFVCEDTNVFVRVLEGEFPDYQKVIPASHILTVLAESSLFLQNLKLANVFAKDSREGNNLVRLTFDNKSNECIFYSSSSQNGEGLFRFPVNMKGEGPVNINFNSKYLLDFFNNTKTQELNIYISGETAPCMFKSPDIEDFLHLIMPIRLNS